MADDYTGKRPRAVVLFSGGLDSILAAEVLRRQMGVDCVLLRHSSIFYPLKGETGYTPPCPTVVRDISEDMARLVLAPRYGHGSNANPCLDCKQMMYGKAAREMEQQQAQFIATGEVLGQRPMSQHRQAFQQMESGAGVEGLVVRPLSGKLLPPTLPEREGLIDREDMLDIQGRSRKRQMSLAAEWGIEDYPQPAGGCKLTDPNYAERIFRIAEKGFRGLEHMSLIRFGRLFVLDGRCFAVVGRNHEDNESIRENAPPGSLLLRLKDRPGPLACLVGQPGRDALEEARRLVLRYSRFEGLPASEVEALPPAEMA